MGACADAAVWRMLLAACAVLSSCTSWSCATTGGSGAAPVVAPSLGARCCCCRRRCLLAFKKTSMTCAPLGTPLRAAASFSWCSSRPCRSGARESGSLALLGTTRPRPTRVCVCWGGQQLRTTPAAANKRRCNQALAAPKWVLQHPGAGASQPKACPHSLTPKHLADLQDRVPALRVPLELLGPRRMRCARVQVL